MSMRKFLKLMVFALFYLPMSGIFVISTTMAFNLPILGVFLAILFTVPSSVLIFNDILYTN